MKQTRIILAGGSGFLGGALAKAIEEKGFEPVILTRAPDHYKGAGRAVYWDGVHAGQWCKELEGSYAVINLTGKNVNCRYTKHALDEINSSRVDSVKAIGVAINNCATPPRVWVQTGSLAIYGDAGDQWCDETTPPGSGTPVETCLKWEEAFASLPTPNTRRVWLRISFVLGREGGALKFLERLTCCYLGGRVGNGRQYISWIHEDDMVRLFMRAVEDEAMEGTFNATSPGAVTNSEFMQELRRSLGRPWAPPTPAWAVPIGCWFLRTEPVLALTGRRGSAQRLLDVGFQFQYPDITSALHQLYPIQK